MRGRWAGALLVVLIGGAGCGGGGARGQTAVAAMQQAADTADQLMIGLSQIMTQDGVRRALLRADSAFFYENAGIVELRGVRLTFYTASGLQSSVLTAREGTYRLSTGAMEARGDVLVIIAADSGRITSTVMRYDPASDRVSSDQAFVYEVSDRHVEGEGFESDPMFTDVVALRPRGTAGRLALPGQ